MAQSPASDCDLVIIGAGLTGLSLACWLAELAGKGQGVMPRVCLLEPRTAYHNDRTWCFWDLAHHPFRKLIAHRWSQWQVAAGDRIVSQSDSRVPYAMLPAGDFYHHALACLDAHSEFELKQGVSVRSVEETDEGVRVATDAGQWSARAVVDTRPPQANRLHDDRGFWQVFIGYEMRCSSHGFPAETAQLMNFQPCREHPCFVYVLPLDGDHLLVEWTEFLPRRQMPDCRGKLETWLASAGIKDYEVLRTESAMLPMLPVRASRRAGRVVRAGVGAGWMRAATGYHFASCQRGSEDLARQILAAKASGDWRLRPPRVRSFWLDWMDTVFLRALRRHPDQASRWFPDLFAGTSAARMARFMNDEPGWRDALAIAAALPPAPFLRALLP